MFEQDKKISLRQWFKDGEAFIWLNAAAVSVSVVAVIGLLLLLAVRGFGHFWPADIMQADYQLPNSAAIRVIGEVVESEQVPVEQIRGAGFAIAGNQPFVKRSLIKQGNRDVTGLDFAWVLNDYLSNISYPETLMAVERYEWGNFYGYLTGLKQAGEPVAQADDKTLWQDFEQRIQRAAGLHEQIKQIEKSDIGKVNYQLERLRLQERGLELNRSLSASKRAQQKSDIALERAALDSHYQVLQAQLLALYEQVNRDSFTAETMGGEQVEIPLAHVVHAYQPNAMNVIDKSWAYALKFWEFLTDEPREANTEGGIFPAIFGTIMMVLLMSVMVTPFGVIAAVYLREYAKQGPLTRTVRIAVNNLAGVPSIVYGVFGLGFFIYFIGAELDQIFFQNALPAPTFGTPGLLWASLTLALLTLPVVIVSTEEGLSRIPKALREGSLALGATKAETLWRVVLPMASPAMMTGLILAVARAAGEVAPLMLVGVVKLAPSLPLDANYPYLHLDQKFMHLGFHIFDVGFQSPNVEAARPLVYATALLLVVIIALLNFSAVALRNHLREKYKSLEM
ncbi:phosphate ABC transporter permease PstA [Dasania sp. GY-MA-18]|uniref:Phosphate transport system permease protein PstA n=1 Tax=Dasania phycosphaerae TaxID=2950436 RepID=A0A9J6RLF6_9GAMM|nr:MULTISPECIES: phosphate ABC transporter permease PstA [Dasania]MCR8922900.1 phosphate ABC transporter permease PstA [Dasania sp. GY-MA-18]MCZ0865331.1 phosphate ABC transporter permease PstA [Dasania phycosphaerae]MCZ0869056.1 phosphate ABC transporter permease PstA [Dasania phycosphaerae]